MAAKSGLTRPNGASSVLAGVLGSDARAHKHDNVPDRRIKPKPYVPLGAAPRK